MLQKDINSFDIETEISPVDLRGLRLSFSADTERNHLLLSRFMSAGLRRACDAAGSIAANPSFLRTLPAFYSIQVAGACPQECPLCPWPRWSLESSGLSPLQRTDFMPAGRFESLLDSIRSFSRDAVIDLSTWGECSLHPDIERLIALVLERPELSLIVETSGIGWNDGILDRLAASAALAARRTGGRPPLSWIVSLDSDEEGRYAAVRGRGFAEAKAFAGKAIAAFPKDAWVQAVRVKGEEEDLEHFYRVWKARTPNVIVQKHDDFCGALPCLKATDLSPVIRGPCWHLMRDMTVLLDGTVPICKEDMGRSAALGNAFTDSLGEIWGRGEALYNQHAARTYPGLCAKCDEYYTYNF